MTLPPSPSDFPHLFREAFWGSVYCRFELRDAAPPSPPATPGFYRLVGYGEVTLGVVPGVPVGGEQVISVESVEVEEASRRFLAVSRPELAELYQLAALLRQRHT